MDETKILNPHKKLEHQNPSSIIPQKSHPNPIVRSTIRKSSSTQIASRNLIKKSVKQLHNHQKLAKQTQITLANNADSQMNDEATLVPTSSTHISRRPSQRLKKSIRPPVDTDNTNTSIDLITPSNAKEIEQSRDIELELDGPYLNESFEVNYRSPKETDFILPKSLTEQIEDPGLLHKHLPKQMDIDRLLEQIKRKVLRNTPFTRIH